MQADDSGRLYCNQMQVYDTSKLKEGERVRIYVNEAPGAAERPKAGWQPIRTRGLLAYLLACLLARFGAAHLKANLISQPEGCSCAESGWVVQSARQRQIKAGNQA